MPLPNSQHYLCIAVALLATPGIASEAEDEIAACARVQSTGDRILCLEEALRRMDATAEDVVGDGSPQPPSAIPEVDDEVPAAEAATPQSEGNPSAAPAATAVIAESVAESAPAAESPAIELGAEQVAKAADVEEKQVRVTAKIVDHTLVGTGRLRLTLDNGQIWQQTGDDDDRVARRIRGETNIEVEMWQSRSGGYRMLLVEQDRVLRVRRIR